MSHGIEENDTMFSVRARPWHGLGIILPEAPATVAEALTASGLGWQVDQEQVYRLAPMTTGNSDLDGSEGNFYVPSAESMAMPVTGYKFNRRQDTGAILGVVSDEYKVVQNEEAFKWLDALLGGDLDWETAGSLLNGKRVWVLAKPGNTVEIGGDETQPYIYCANSHDGSQAVTASATSVRIVCQNTLNWAMARSEHSPRTYRFRHTGNLAAKLEEARTVMEIALDWDAALKRLGDSLAQQKISVDRFDTKVVRPFVGLDDPALEGRKIAIRNREDKREILLETFKGNGPDGDTSGNSPRTKWCAANAIIEYADWGRRVTQKTDQVQRSFEDETTKQKALDLVIAA